jgi:hypothetical protein
MQQAPIIERGGCLMQEAAADMTKQQVSRGMGEGSRFGRLWNK